ncbi:hypothetical protein [Desulfoscipio gibsoniae]
MKEWGELIKITPDGKSFVLTSLDMLPQSILEDAAGFYQSSVSPQRIFTILEKKDSRKVIIEIDKDGKFIKEHDLFEKGLSGFIKFYEGDLFIRSYHVLYKYDLETGALENIFDEPLDKLHHHDVVDLAKTDNGYLLLVTNSDTGNYTDVWKLRNDGTLQRDFIETNPDFDE